MKIFLQSIRTLAVLTILTGALYPLVVTVFARVIFPEKASGSIVVREGAPVGSNLLAQQTQSPRYFWPRPSAADYATVASAASNKGPTSVELQKAVAERRKKFGPDAPTDLLTASGSGLDPHITPEAARHQAPRIAQARGLEMTAVLNLIKRQAESPQLGLLGQPRVNVLALNLALDAQR